MASQTFANPSLNSFAALSTVRRCFDLNIPNKSLAPVRRETGHLNRLSKVSATMKIKQRKIKDWLKHHGPSDTDLMLPQA